MAAMAGPADFSLTGDGEPAKVSAYMVTANTFPLLGVRPAIGRSFLAEEDVSGSAKVVVLSYGLWKRRYAGDTAIVGREILLNGEKHTVVGAMPQGFQFLDSAVDLWVPIAFDKETLANRGGHYL